MGRPREFDIDEALDAAMAPFWRHGYEATSLADLIEATGLQKGSIYKAFGSKHELFVRVLHRYLDQLYAQILEVVEGTSSPRDAIRAYLEFVQQMGQEGTVRQGCLAVNTLIELAPHDDEVRGMLVRHQRRAVRALSGIVEEGQVQGSFRKDVAPEELAAYLMTATAGLVAVSKSSPPQAAGASVVDLILSALEG